MPMIVRNCAGGVVFNGNKVFILKNEKNEWVLPKGKIRNGFLAQETAIERVNAECGVDAVIVSTGGETSYEFYSFTRQMPVYNKITWYIMESYSDEYHVNKEQGFKDGGFFNIKEAIDKITYSQDKSLVTLSYKKYLVLKEIENLENIYV